MSSDAPLYYELWNYTEPEETAVKFQALLPDIKAAGDESATLQLLTQIGRTQSLQRKFKEAHTILNEVEAQLTDDLTVATIRYLLERGRTFNSNNQPELARPLFISAYELGNKAGEDYHAIDAAHMMGIAGANNAEKMQWNEIALKAAQKTDNPFAKKWIGSLSNNIGWTYHEQGEYEKALDLFQQTQKYYRYEFPHDRYERIARWAIAKTHRSLHQLEEALIIQQTLHQEYIELEEENGYVFEEIGECLYAMNKPNEAAPFFADAYEILSQDDWLQANEPERLARLKLLSV